MAMTQSTDEMTRSREVAESARESEWQGAGFLRELFLGKLRLDLIHPYPLDAPERPEFRRFYAEFEQFLREKVDPARIDETGEYPPEVIDGLRKLGAFGMKIPAEYGGLGFTQVEYGEGDAARRRLRREPHGAALRAPVDRRPAAAQALRLARAQEEVPAADREGRDQRVRAHRGARRLGSGAALDDARAHPGRQALRPQRRRSSGARTARSPSSSSSWRRNPKTNAISAFVVETDWPGVEVDASLPVHGAARARERGDPLHGREGPGREPHRQGGARPQDRAHHAQHRPALAAGRGGGRRQAVPRALAQVVQRPASSGARRSASTRRSPTSSPRWPPPCSRWRRSPISPSRSPTRRATTSGSRRRPRRSGTRSGRGGSSTRRCRSAAAAATRRRARSRRAARRPSDVERAMRDCASTSSSRAPRRSCTSSWRARPWTSTSRSRAPSSTRRSRSARSSPRSRSSARSTCPGTWACGCAGCGRPRYGEFGKLARTCASSSARAASSRARSSTGWWSSRRPRSGSRRSCSGSWTSRTSCSRWRRA